MLASNALKNFFTGAFREEQISSASASGFGCEYSKEMMKGNDCDTDDELPLFVEDFQLPPLPPVKALLKKVLRGTPVVCEPDLEAFSHTICLESAVLFEENIVPKRYYDESKRQNPLIVWNIVAERSLG